VDVEQRRGTVSVVIPTFNRRDSIAEIVQPVLNDPATGEVVLVIDGSRDGTLEFLQEWSRVEPRIRAIFQENAGEAVARQRGVEEANLDIVVLLDDDVITSSGMIGAHARHHVVEKRQVVLGYMPTPLPEPRRPGQVATVLYSHSYEMQCAEYEENSKSIFDNFWMGNVSMRRSCALEVGLASGIHILRHADMEFGFRCRDAGIEAIFDRSLLARHRHRRSLRQFATQCRQSGYDRAKLTQVYSQYAQLLDPFNASKGLKKILVRTLSSVWLHPLCASLMVALSVGAGRTRAWSIETRSAEVLGRLEVCHGFKSAQRDSGARERAATDAHASLS
jgi:glycosyltransferase involved in cell wall biosynthesis